MQNEKYLVHVNILQINWFFNINIISNKDVYNILLNWKGIGITYFLLLRSIVVSSGFKRLDKLQSIALVRDPRVFFTFFITSLRRTFSEIDKQLYKPLLGLINLVGLSN